MITSAPLRYGYTMVDLDHLAHTSVHIAWPRNMDYRDRYEAAWHAIAEAIYSSDERPTPRDLKLAGTNAVNRLAQDEGHHRGLDRSNPAAGLEGMPNFQRYWALHHTTPSPEDAIVDRVALAQIWPELSRTHRRVLLALAVYADHPLAAEAMGRSLATYRSHLKGARRAYRGLWHEHETPSAMWGQSLGRRGRRTAAQSLANRIQQRARRARKAAAA